MGIEPIISSLQDWCLTTMALEALNRQKKTNVYSSRPPSEHKQKGQLTLMTTF